METNTKGFTIVEVMLFLGISSLLLIGTFAASSGIINETRFTDSIRGLESYLQRQYEEVTSGVNPRSAGICNGAGSANPGASNCLLLGKLIVFRASDDIVESYTIIGDTNVTPPSNGSLEATLVAFSPRTVPSSLTTYTIPWEAQFTNGRRVSAPQAVNAIAFLRSPVSSQVGIYHFGVSIPGGTALSLTTANALNSNASKTTAGYCVAGRDGAAGRYRAAITFEQGQGSAVIGSMLQLPVTGAPC